MSPLCHTMTLCSQVLSLTAPLPCPFWWLGRDWMVDQGLHTQLQKDSPEEEGQGWQEGTAFYLNLAHALPSLSDAFFLSSSLHLTIMQEFLDYTKKKKSILSFSGRRSPIADFYLQTLCTYFRNTLKVIVAQEPLWCRCNDSHSPVLFNLALHYGLQLASTQESVSHRYHHKFQGLQLPSLWPCLETP
jgi:hypothetical protein